MTSNHVWRPELNVFPAAAALANLNPYSQWLLLHGREFEAACGEAKQDPDDFSYLASLTRVAGALPSAVGATSFTANEQAGDLGFRIAHSGVWPLGDAPSMVQATDVAVIRLPLRKDSIPAANLIGAPPVWSNPRAINSENMVIVAAIDDGFNPFHQRFRNAAGKTCMEYLWVQDGVHSGTQSDIHFGHEFTADDLNRPLAEHGDDEDRLMAETRLVNFSRPGTNRLARHRSHGTHVLDTAAGADPAQAPANRCLIGVKLPSLVTLEPNEPAFTFFYLQALSYILRRARMIGQSLGQSVPVVVNFSYGFSGGPHDGFSDIEAQTERLIADHLAANGGPVYPVFPTGNQQGKRGHAQVQGAGGAEVPLKLRWRILPADGAASFLEVWAPLAAGDGYTVEITPPNSGAVTLAVTPAAPQVLMEPVPSTALESVIARVSAEAVVLNGVAKKRLLIAIAPTDAAASPGRSPAPSGVWQIEARAKVQGTEWMHAWVKRDESPVGYRPRGGQSYLDEPQYQRFRSDTPIGDWLDEDPAGSASPVTRSGTISGMTGGDSSYVAGGYWGRSFQEDTAFYSAQAIDGDPVWGQKTHNGKAGSARTDTSRALPGILGAGTRSGSRVAMNGTSVAAPQIVREIVRLLGLGLPVPAALLAGLNKPSDPNPPANFSPSREGAGRLPVAPELRFQVERDHL